jgi:hypothetical protein
MAIYFRDAEVLSVLFISGDPFISGFPGLTQRLWLSVQWISEVDDDDGVSCSSVYFGTLEWDLWLHIPSDGCDQSRDQASVHQMIR